MKNSRWISKPPMLEAVDYVESTGLTREKELQSPSPCTSPEPVDPNAQPRTVQVPTDVSNALLSKGLYADQDGLVRWREDSTVSVHPRRWQLLRPVYDSAVICFMEIFTTLKSNAGSSIASEAKDDLAIRNELALFCFTTLYLLGQALGGLVFPPVAETFGGKSLYLSCTTGFSAACVILGACPTLAVVIVVCFITGFLSAMPGVVAVGSIENIWDTQARIWLIHVWIRSAVLGLVVAPAIATVVSESYLGWHWNFHIAAAVTANIAVMCFGIEESRPSQLLKQQVKDLKHKASLSKLSLNQTDSTPSVKTFVQTSLRLPGVMYLFSVALPGVYGRGYGFTTLQSSLVSLSIGVGVAFSFLPRISNLYVACWKSARAVQPEDKLMGFFIVTPIHAIGLWWFAFTVPPLVQGVSGSSV
ncbi:hypothetical protein DOTSEDRAFT_39598 [Dothistroma septosporum NZE10]|uniref:Major facilitator superfamily (MFS) profile domain-containing protein n=1 Tax=Dothistroma septosporum (strain NZE10 / CBS 128990) TaxID=675120 RepID=M2XZD1_DOTSN|nr:hypothetical protein DOTSEDRAFT_39598 [Dothistroma septosporum NZE10]